MKPFLSLAALAGALALAPAPTARAADLDHPDFSDPSGLALNGAAAVQDGVLHLVPAAQDVAGSAFHTSAFDLNAFTSFSTRFRFHVEIDAQSGMGVTDGFAFLFQSESEHALGLAGQGLGYVGIADSVAVVFRGRGPSFVGAIAAGVDPADLPEPFNPPGSVAMAEGAFYGGDHYAWIEYTPGLLSVWLSGDATRPDTPLMQAAIDLHGTLGDHAWVGFTAGNGGAFARQRVHEWTLSAAQVPEPPALLLMLLGVALLRWRRASAAAA